MSYRRYPEKLPRRVWVIAWAVVEVVVVVVVWKVWGRLG